MNAIPGENSNSGLGKTVKGKENLLLITKSKLIKVIEWLMASGRLA